MTESNFVRHEPCPKCGSSDAYSVYDDGHGYCFSCNTYFNANGKQTKGERKMASGTINTREYDGQTIALTARGISEETCKKFKYEVIDYKGTPCQVAPYFDNLGNLVGQKLRFPDKSFAVKGKISGCLFGSQLWTNGKQIVITEGEIDCLTVSQLQGNKWPVVSIPNGAQAGKKAIQDNLEYLNNFEKIILMFDMDEQGREATEEVAKVLPVGKAYVSTLPLKDANECLKAGKGAEVVNAIWQAKPYRPDGIVAGADLHDKCVMENELDNSVPYPWEVVNEKTYGIRLGELVTITSGSGMGKSTLLRELEYYFGTIRGEKCGIIALEESTRKTGLELMGLFLDKRLSVHASDVCEDAKEKAFNKTIGNGNYFLYDHFGSLDSGNLLSKIRYMIVSLGCKRIFLDHISIVVSGMDADEDGGERKAIDKLMTNLRSLVEETECTLFVVSHLKRPEKKGHEEGGQVSLAQLRGSGAIAQLSDMVIGLERNQQGDNPNVVTLRILKNRFSGDTGVSGQLYYNKETGRLDNYTEDSYYDDVFHEEGGVNDF